MYTDDTKEGREQETSGVYRRVAAVGNKALRGRPALQCDVLRIRSEGRRLLSDHKQETTWEHHWRTIRRIGPGVEAAAARRGGEKNTRRSEPQQAKKGTATDALVTRHASRVYKGTTRLVECNQRLLFPAITRPPRRCHPPLLHTPIPHSSPASHGPHQADCPQVHRWQGSP